MKFIDQIRKATTDTITEIKWPAQWGRIQRAFADVSDDAEAQVAYVDDRLLDLTKQFATAEKSELKALVLKGIELQLDLEAAKTNAKIATEWLEKLSAEVEE